MFVIGSRGSPLALWQAYHVASLLRSLGHSSSIRVIKTTGDHLQTASLAQAGGKGLFTKEIEEALLSGDIDIAVHSLKDLPTEQPPGLAIAAIPAREDPFDAIVGAALSEIPQAAKIGTSSLRRGAQLRLLRPDLQIEPIRGNVDTRLRKLDAGEYQAILLASAGLHRLGLAGRIAQVLTADEVCPAPGQGALAIQTRADDPARTACAAVGHPETHDCVTAERLVLSALGGGCQLPVGVYARLTGDQLKLTAVAVAPDASSQIRGLRSGPRAAYKGLAIDLAGELLRRGAGALLSCAS